MTPSPRTIIYSYPIRLAIYAAMTLLLYQLVFMMLQTHGAETMGAENGPIEAAQLCFAIAAAGGLFLAAGCTRIGRSGLTAAAAVVAYAAAREADMIMETLLFDDAYKYLVGLPMIAIVSIVAYRHRHRLIEESMWLMKHPAATIFAMAGIYLCVVCQFLDRPAMWTTITDPHQSMATKAMIEEYAELFAYVMLFFSSLEATGLAIVTRRPLPASSPLPKQTEHTSRPRKAA